MGLPDAPDQIYASMGNYVFTADALIEAVTVDAAQEASGHDMGGDIIPMLVAAGGAEVYDFATNEVPGATDRDRGYWRDVGTLDAYYEAHMDLVSVAPVFNLLQHGMAHPHLEPARCPRRSSFSTRRGRGQRHRLHGLRRGGDLRRRRPPLDRLAGRARAPRGRGSRAP